VHCLLAQRDALVVMPTGGGKSICFQLPALLQQGLTLVVSPLVALMENQLQELRSKRLPAASLHSELSRQDYRRSLALLEQNRLRLLYLSPETLLSSTVWERLCQPTLAINGLILDEAHCLVQWGETFRPAYYRLGAVRSALLQHKPPGSQLAIAAFTATADPIAQQTIQRILQLQNPAIFQLNPYRANLTLTVDTVWSAHQRRQKLLRFIQRHPQQAGLVYVRTRRDSETLATWLAEKGFATAAYHAGLGGTQRREIEQAWLTDRLQFVACTNAFGMGINKPNVRWVAHFHAPLLLSEYVQEIGRAGRDGKPATALTLISETTGLLDPSDRQRHHFFAAQMQKQQQTAMALRPQLPATGEVATVSRTHRDGAITLAMLHGTGQLEWIDPFHYRIHSSHNKTVAGVSNHQAAEQMTCYLKARSCRWAFLLSSFGFTAEAMHFRCGHCDNCR